MHVQLQEKTFLIKEDHGALRIRSPWVDLAWNEPSHIHRDLFVKLAHEPTDTASLAARVFEEEGSLGLSLFYHTLNQLQNRALLSLIVMRHQEPLLTLVPLAPSFKWKDERLEETELFTLARSCSSFVLNKENVLETPLQTARVIIKDPSLIPVLRALQNPTSLKKLSEEFPLFDPEVLEKCLKLLRAAKMLSPVTL
jgi:hypothetical protein